MDALLSEIAMGWANYDPLGAAACHNLFAQNPCGFGYAALLLAPSIQLALASCPGLIAGNRLPGETCASSADCVAGYACTAFLTVCPGTCTPIPGPPGPPPPPPPPPSEGDPCGSGGCGSTTYCSSAGFCRLRRGEGGFCTDNAHCQAGLTCLPGEVCGPVSGGGDPCDDDLDCCTDLWCRGTTCSALPGLGEPCTPGSPPRCANGLACWGPGGICAQAPRALCPGDDCTVANTTCIASICAGGICQTGAYLGDPCAVNSDCASRSCPAGVCADGYACLP